jgi:hypothetical protein
MSVPARQRGTAGKPLSVTTNSFKIESLPQKQFYQYDGMYPVIFSNQSLVAYFTILK